MSDVPRSKRSTPSNGFIAHMTDTRIEAYNLFKPFPRFYYGGVLETAKHLVDDGYIYVIAGNSIFLGENTLPDDFRLRRSLMLHGKAKWEVFGRELTFLKTLLDRGQNFLGSKFEYYPLFETLGNGVKATVESIGRVISKNKKTWEERHGPLADWMLEPMDITTTDPVEVLRAIDVETLDLNDSEF